MNHLWHLTRYDLRALWKQAVFLALVQIITTSISLSPKSTDPFSFQDRLIDQILIMLWGATVVSLLAAIAFQYPVFKTTSYWLTRPVRPLTILLSRFLSACLLVVLPTALINGVTLLIVGMRSDVALDNTTKFTLVMLAASGPVLLLATLAGNLGRFWVALVGILIGFFVVGTKTFPVIDLVSPPLESTRSGLSLVLLVIGSLVGLGISYAQRSRLRSIAMAIVTVLAMCGVGLVWPWPLSMFTDRDLPEIDAPAALTAAVSPSRDARVDSVRKYSPGFIYAGVVTLIPSAPDPTQNAARLEGVVTYPSPHKVPRYAWAKIDSQYTVDHLVKAALGTDFSCVNADGVVPSFIFALRQKGSPPSQPERFIGSVRVETGSPRLVAELPITPEERRRFDSASLTIASSDLTGDHCDLTVLHDDARRSFTQATAAERGLADGTYLLINRRLKQAVHLTVSKNWNHHRIVFGYRCQQVQLSADLPDRADVTPAQWLADATLGVIATAPENFFRLPVEFPLNPNAPADRAP